MKKTIVIALTTLALPVLGLPALAQTFPARPIEVVVPYPAGGQTDITARAVAEGFQRTLGGSAVVVNKGGAAGLIGMQAVAQAAPDGHTVAITPIGTITVQQQLRNSPPYTAASFDPICRLTESALVLGVKSDSPYRTAQEFIAAAKANPGKLSYGHVGPGSIPHLLMEHFKHSLGLNILSVAYRGGPAVMQGVLGGEIEAGTLNPVASGQQFRSLAVMSGTRLKAQPDVPTFGELGVKDVEAVAVVVVAPKGINPAIRQRLEDACGSVAKDPAFVQVAERNALNVAFTPGAAVRTQMERETALMAQLIARANLPKE